VSAAAKAAVVTLAVVPPAAWFAVLAASSETGRLVLLAHALYWLMPALLAFAALCGAWRLTARETTLRATAAAMWPGAVLAVVLTAAVFWLVPPEMRVQFDETSLASVSQNMHEQRLAVLTTGALPAPDGLLRLENMPDKRPPLFPFLVSVLHDLTGQRIANTFAVNAALLAIGLFAAFAAARARLGLAAAAAAPLLLLAVPIVVAAATSAGFELLAAVLFGLVLLAAADFVRRPDSRRWAGFLGIGVLFAASRYESLPVLAGTAALALWAARGRWRADARAVFGTALVPGLVAPLVLQMLHAGDPDFYPEAAGQPLVSLRHAAEHLLPFLARAFSPRLDDPLPGLLAMAAVAAWGAWLLRGRGSRIDAVVAVPVLAATAATLAWFAGDVREPISVRLFLPFSCACALAPLLWPAMAGRRAAVALLLAAVVLASLRVDAVRRGAAFPRTESARLTQALDAAVARVAADPATTLWVGAPAQHLIVTGHAALAPRSFARHGAEVRARWQRGEITAVYLVETPIDDGMAPAFGHPRDVLGAFRSEVTVAASGDVPIRVHRLLR
jgi:hypothetical protein